MNEVLDKSFVVEPNGTIGILGGGQLGRMLATAAAELGLKTHILCPDEEAPAYDAASAHTVAGYLDEHALAAFAKAVDVVTYEFENVPVEAVEFLTNCGVAVRPGAKALENAQDRLVEKEFANSIGADTAAEMLIIFGDNRHFGFQLGVTVASRSQLGLPA